MADYAEVTDLPLLGVANEALEDIEEATQEAVIAARSRFADGYLAVRYTIPDGGLTAFTGDLTWAVVQLSVYDLISNRGYDVDGKAPDIIRQRHDDAIKWLEAVRDGEIALVLPDESEASDSPGAPIVNSDVLRGWQRCRQS